MLAGISTACLYPQLTEDALAIYAANGVRSAEVFINSVYELEPAYIKELKAIADSGGVKVLSVHPFTSGMEPILFFSRYERRFNDGRELYKRFCAAAVGLGADILVFHGNIIELAIFDEDYYERFGILLEDAKKEGVRLCHENVCRCAGRLPDFFRRLAKNFPEAGFVFDTKQALRSGVDIIEFAKAMGGNISHIHISDHDGDRDCLPPGKGTFNIAGFLEYMRSVGFDGGVIVELYKDNFGEVVELLGGYQHVCEKISTVT